MTQATSLNFREICRLCMTRNGSLTPVFRNSTSAGVMSLSEKIMYFVPELKLCAEDDLPNQVCQRCSRLANLSYKFKLQCESSDVTLRRYLKTHSFQDNKDKIIHSVFRNDTGENWDYQAIKIDVAESYDEDFNNQCDSDVEKSEADLPDDFPDDEWKDMQSSSTIETEEIMLEDDDDKSKVECIISEIGNRGHKFEKIKKLSKKSNKNTGINVKSQMPVLSEKTLTISDAAQGKDEAKKECIKKSKTRTRGEKKGFLCQDCGKNFSYEQHLLLHRRSHTGEKPFSCSVCGECFSVSSNLNKHMRIHTGERPFLCTVCGRSFSRSDTLTKHMRSHTGEKPFHCALCGNNFGRRSILTNHMRTHSGEKPYLCTECGQRFAQSYDLTKHTRMHTGEKPYQCRTCRMSFGQRSSLTKHLKSHSGEVSFPSLDFPKGLSYKTDSVKLVPHTEQVRILTHSYKY